MKAKILTLGLICFFIFAYCNSPADPEIEKALNDPVASLILPTIVSFTSSNPDRDRYITISWEVKNATSIWLQFPKSPLQRDVSHMPIGSVNHDVYGKSREDAVRMTYALAASNDDGSVREEIEVVSASAILEITTIPPVPVFTYVVDPEFPNNESKSYWTTSFTIVLTETYGIGGEVRIELYKPYDGPGAPGFGAMRDFEPYGILTSSASRRLYRPASYQPPSELIIRAQINDNNGFWTEPFVKIFLLGPN